MSSQNRINIASVYSQCSPETKCEGTAWYQYHRDLIEREIRGTRFTLDSAVCAFSALSPRVQINNNIKDFLFLVKIVENNDHLSQGILSEFFAYESNVQKAFNFLVENASFVETFPKLTKSKNSNKIKDFAYCLFYPNNQTSVCIDTHAYSIWAGRRVKANDVEAFKSLKSYSEVVQDYLAVANNLGIVPNQLQAITWIGWRKLIQKTELAA